MRRELTQYFSNPHESNGLLLAQAPTGTEKSLRNRTGYFSICSVRRTISGPFHHQPAQKSYPAEDLRKIYEKNGIGDRFDKEVLVLASTASAVEQAIVSENIPAEFQTSAYQELLSACKSKQRLMQQSGESSPSLTQLLSEQIRTELEPQFRHALETHLRKSLSRRTPTSAGKLFAARKSINGSPSFTLPFSGLTIKILLLSVKKLMARNVTLVEPALIVCPTACSKNRLVCIDEF